MSMNLAGLHPGLRPAAEWCLKAADLNKIPVTLTSVVRGWAEQTRLRAQYEACLARGETISPDNPDDRCHYPANQPGDSAHNFGFAWDSWVPPEHRAAWKQIREMAGFRVPENDLVHAELPDWRNYRQYVTIYR